MVKKILRTKSLDNFRSDLRIKRRRMLRAGDDANALADKHFFNRLSQVSGIRRFLASWLALMLLLIFGVGWQVMSLGRYYLQLQPAQGGTFREGVLGSYTNANPIYATSVADSSISALIFSGLLSYNTENALTPSLAESWSVDDSGKTYTLKIRNNLKWHDGQQFTVEDVLYTFETIQDADARSPLFRNWQGVSVTSTDPSTVVFTLSSALSGFEHSLTTGIIPKHLLSKIEPAQLRSANFNTIKPVGTGPFKMSSVDVSGSSVDNRQEIISLSRYDNFHLGTPEIENYVLRVFRNGSQLLQAFNNRELNAAIGLSSTDIDVNQESLVVYNIPQLSAVMLFMNNSSPFLNDVKVRQALVQSTNVPEILKSIGYPLIQVDQPFLRGQVGYDKSYAQYGYDLEAANKLLDESGWIKNSSGIREKDGKQLKFRLFSQSLAEYALVVQKLQDQWRSIGVEIDAILQPEEDLQTGAIARHDYDALLYGISIGPDSDVYPYWHSSQADPRSPTRLNLSEFKNTAADNALEAGRSRTDDALRALKFKPFSENWKSQAPAIGLYQPRFLYVVRGQLSGFAPNRLNSVSDRFRNVHEWTIRQQFSPTF
ncbi:MAG: peptide ABC transporter substrate-binding protein [bacterium]|nr:peptide ABC transporter substrate-binding protein [bacterium]